MQTGSGGNNPTIEARRPRRRAPGRRSATAAIRAIAWKCRTPYPDAKRLVEAIERKHKPIERHFHSDAGRRLQRIDSDMAEMVVLDMIGRGYPALPIHDSFLVPAKAEDAAREAWIGRLKP